MDKRAADIVARHNPGFSHATRPSMDSNIEERPSIFGNWQCLDDFGSSFIPETEKSQIFTCMTQSYGLDVRSYLEYLHEKEAVAWSYYHGVDKQFRTKNSEHFIEHLLVNSCLLLFMMVFYSAETTNVIADIIIDQYSLQLFVNNNTIRTVCYMFTMNYQIPWVFVEAVFTQFSNLGERCVIPIHKIALLSMESMNPRRHPSKVLDGPVPEGGFKFKHLLHIFHWSRQPANKYLVDSTANKWIGNFHIPSATELQLSQTVFKKHASDPIDVSYRHGRLRGVMQLAPWYFMQYSTKLYESLLRFEQGYHGVGGVHFSAYFACMACLIKTEEDVKVLRANDVIPSISSIVDQDVLRCVQELKTLIDDNLIMPSELIDLEEKVMTHHKKCVYRVIGEFKKRYCSNTWITISVIAGFILFVLTVIQTIYSVCSYKKNDCGKLISVHL